MPDVYLYEETFSVKGFRRSNSVPRYEQLHESTHSCEQLYAGTPVRWNILAHPEHQNTLQSPESSSFSRKGGMPSLMKYSCNADTRPQVSFLILSNK